MKLVAIGVGRAGGRVLDRLLAYETTRGTDCIQHAVAVSSSDRALESLDHVPTSTRLLLGRASNQDTASESDRDVGAARVQEHLDEIQTAVGGTEPDAVDAFLIIAGLGGQTGSGGAPLIAERFQSRSSKPVFGLGLLPTTAESGRKNYNTAVALHPFVEHTDTVLAFDNDPFKPSAQSLPESYDELNGALATRFGLLFAAGEIEAMSGPVADTVVDPSEVIETLSGHGLASLGYAAESLESDSDSGFLSRLFGSDKPEFVSTGDAVNRLTGLARRATLGTLTLPCEVKSTSRAYVIVAGPPAQLDREGINEARKIVEENTDCRNVRIRTYPLPTADRVAVLVVLSGVTEVPRIEEIQELAEDPE